MSKSLVYGVGVNDLDSKINPNGKNLPFYDSWHRMLERCYSSKRHATGPTYAECVVCDEWAILSNFKRWYDANYVEGYHLDKDILIEGNKVYSPEACRFVPRHINNLIIGRTKTNDLPLGVRVNNGSFSGSVHCNTTKKALRKTFKTIAEAKLWYSVNKKIVVKQQAIEAFLANEIKSDIYLALIRREF